MTEKQWDETPMKTKSGYPFVKDYNITKLTTAKLWLFPHAISDLEVSK